MAKFLEMFDAKIFCLLPTLLKYETEVQAERALRRVVVLRSLAQYFRRANLLTKNLR